MRASFHDYVNPRIMITSIYALEVRKCSRELRESPRAADGGYAIFAWIP
jgi:hypothetical protein